MKISVLGDICLARLINSKFKASNYQIVSSQILALLQKSDFVLANLEAPICKEAETDGDHLSFRGSPEVLEQFTFVDCFSLSNNHINDCGSLGMNETIEIIQDYKITHNGLFQKNYSPVILENEGNKIAVFTCTDMMNIPFSADCLWKTLHIDDPHLDELIAKYKKDNYFIMLYAHVGILFSRFVNPPIRNLLHEKIDHGADLIITAHSHCVGGMEYYKGKPIFHSIGDFVMDGGSYRRRQAVILNFEIKNNHFLGYDVIPTIINSNLETVLASKKLSQRILNSWANVSKKLQQHSSNYTSFFKWQYKVEMLQHTASTLRFLFKSKGILGMCRLIVKRYQEVIRMGKWLTANRSNDRRDDEAILPGRKKFLEKELFKND
jgi:poly-gamma-glutamate synthesis protein (capsule biosynthesis protein)